MIKRNIFSLILVVGIGCQPAGGEVVPQQDATPPEGTAASQDLPESGWAWVIIGSDTVRAETAVTAEERADGLMFRDSLEEGTGMLFVYETERTLSFWMSNTFISLDIAYINSTQTIVDIQQMEPETTTSHPSASPAMFALEVPKGWFEKMGIEVGDQTQIVFGR